MIKLCCCRQWSDILFQKYVCFSVCPFVHSCVCTFNCISVYPYICLSICLSVCLFVCLYVCMYVCKSICLSDVYLSVRLSMCLCVIFPSMWHDANICCLSNCQPICLSTNQFLCPFVCLCPTINQSIHPSIVHPCLHVDGRLTLLFHLIINCLS